MLLQAPGRGVGHEEGQTRSAEARCRADAGIGHSGARPRPAADPGRIQHRPDRSDRGRRPGGARGAAPLGRRRQCERRPAWPQGRARRLRRPGQPRNDAGHLLKADRRRQGRLADRSVRDRAYRAHRAARQAAQAPAHGQLLVPGECPNTARHVVQQRTLERRRELVRGILQDRAGCRGREQSPSSPPTTSSPRIWPTARASSRSGPA